MSTCFSPWKPNARFQARRRAGAGDERTLFAVAYKPWFGAGYGVEAGIPHLLLPHWGLTHSQRLQRRTFPNLQPEGGEVSAWTEALATTCERSHSVNASRFFSPAATCKMSCSCSSTTARIS